MPRKRNAVNYANLGEDAAIDDEDDLLLDDHGTPKSNKENEEECVESEASSIDLSEEDDESDFSKDDFEPVSKKAKKTPEKKSTTASTKSKKSTSKAASVKKTADKGPAKITTDKKAMEVTMEYMEKQNRPYSVINVYDNLHKSIGKAMLTRALDELCTTGKLKCKPYGKSKVYYLNQENVPMPSEEELNSLKEELKNAQDRIDKINEEQGTLDTEVHELSNEMTDEQLIVAIQELETKIPTLEAKVEEWEKKATEPVSPGKKAKLQSEFNKYRKVWVARKRIAVDAVSQVAEGLEKKNKEVFELCGVETDQDVGIETIPTL